MRKIKKISAQSVEQKETESVSRRTEKALTREDFLEIGVTIHNRQRLPQRAPQPRNGMLVKTAALHIGIDYTRPRRRDREREGEEGGREKEKHEWQTNYYKCSWKICGGHLST